MKCVKRAGALAVALLMLLSGSATAYRRPEVVRRLDVTSDGMPAAGMTNAPPSISANGRWVAFESDTADLVPGDTNRQSDVFLRDMRTGRVELVSKGIAGTSAIGPPLYDERICTDGSQAKFPLPGFSLGCESLSADPAISATGRFVVFTSLAINIVPFDKNLAADVFVYDRVSGEMKRVSVDSEGDEATAGPPFLEGSFLPSISANGRYISFTSDAIDLVPGDSNLTYDVFVHDLETGDTVRASVTFKGEQAEQWTNCAPCTADRYTVIPYSSISGDGRFVAFDSSFADLVPDDTNSSSDVFVRGLVRGRTERVSVASDGAQATPNPGESRAQGSSNLWGDNNVGVEAPTSGHAISDDGRFVAFTSQANDLVPNDTHGRDVFVHDRKTERTERVSVAEDGRETPRPTPVLGGNQFGFPSIDGNGRSVVFIYWGLPVADSSAYTIDSVPGALIHDRRTGAVEPLIAPSRPDGDSSTRWNSDTDLPDISASGRFVTFGLRSGNDEHKTGGSCKDSRLCRVLFWMDRGLSLGVGNAGRAGEATTRIDGPLIRSQVITVLDRDNDASARVMGAEIIGASLAYRPTYQDLFFKIDVDRLPGARGLGLAGNPFLVYTFRLTAEGTCYEARISKAGVLSSFGLCECGSAIPAEQLSGGVGTVGESVVASLPLNSIGLTEGGSIEDVTATSRLATNDGVALQLMDRVALPEATRN